MTVNQLMELRNALQLKASAQQDASGRCTKLEFSTSFSNTLSSGEESRYCARGRLQGPSHRWPCAFSQAIALNTTPDNTVHMSMAVTANEIKDGVLKSKSSEMSPTARVYGRTAIAAPSPTCSIQRRTVLIWRFIASFVKRRD